MHQPLSSTDAARYLHQHDSSRSSDEWRIYLQNNRNPSRPVTFRVPFSTSGNRVRYSVADLDALLEWLRPSAVGQGVDLAPRAAEIIRAFGIGEAAGSATGRRFTLASVEAAVDPNTAMTFIRMTLAEPLMVYRLELDQAAGLITKLNGALESAHASPVGRQVSE